MILNIKNSSGHCASGQRDRFKVLSHVVVSKSFCHLYCTSLHHFTIRQGLLCISKLKGNYVRRLQGRFLGGRGFGKKALLTMYFPLQISNDSGSGSSGVFLIFVFVRRQMPIPDLDAYSEKQMAKPNKNT